MGPLCYRLIIGCLDCIGESFCPFTDSRVFSVYIMYIYVSVLHIQAAQ